MPVIADINVIYGHGALVCQTFPTGDAELSLEDGPVVAILREGEWHLRKPTDKGISSCPPGPDTPGVEIFCRHCTTAVPAIVREQQELQDIICGTGPVERSSGGGRL